jgi:primosomal protein N' (replication factor Y)
LGEEPGALREALKGDVVIATEAALAEVERPAVAVVIALGVEGYFRKPKGRAAEDAFAALWALAGLASGRKPKGRMIIEARNPEHHAIQAVVRGDYRFFARKELESREAAGAPPFKRLIRVQTTPQPSTELVNQLRSLPGTVVLGPVPGGSLGAEILLKADDLETILDALGTMVASSPQRVLVEVDPKDW